MNLGKNTVVVLTADHGQMAGSHGGLRGKGPFAYELNSHVPLLIAHPAYAGGKTCQALTSHLDLLPTLVAMTGLPEPQRAAAVKGLPGHDFSVLLRNHKVRTFTPSVRGFFLTMLAYKPSTGSICLAQ